MKRNLKSRNGITLIALIITIIILLILAMVTINILINQGIIGHANNAVRGYEVAEEKEQITLAYQNYKMDKVNKDDAKLKVPGANGDQDIEQDDDDTWYILFDKTGHGYELNENGDVSTAGERWAKNADGSYTKNGTTIKVGDYVDYTYDTVEDGYLVEAKYSGYTEDQTITQPETKLQWRILDISKSKVTLISASPTDKEVYFSGALGYNNGVYLMDDMCTKLYSNSTLGVTARSIDLEDIEAQMNETGLAARDNYVYKVSSSSTKYGSKMTCTDSYSYYPNAYAQEKGQGINSDDVSIVGKSKSDPIYGEPTEETYTQASEKKLTVTQTYYCLDSNSIKSGFKNGTGSIICTGSTAWVASRSVSCSSYAANFGFHRVESNSLHGYNMLTSSHFPISLSACLRPIVELPSNIVIGSEGGTESNPRSLTLQQ